MTRHRQLPKAKSGSDAGEGFYSAYAEYAKIIRAWLVAYGIGGPALILSQDAIWRRLAGSGQLRQVAALFLIGVALQVLLAVVNKTVLWVLYYGELDERYKTTPSYKLSEWLSASYGIDFSCEVASLVLFALATYKCFVALTGVVA